MRPIAGDKRAREREIQGHRKTQLVEPDGTTRKYMFLPGEILPVRAGKKSADAVVALKPVERQEERRAEESRKTNQSGPGNAGRTEDRNLGALQLRQPPQRYSVIEQADTFMRAPRGQRVL